MISIIFVILITIFALLLFFPDFIYNSIFVGSLRRGMEIQEKDAVVRDPFTYKDINKPIYYDFNPEVLPM